MGKAPLRQHLRGRPARNPVGIHMKKHTTTTAAFVQRRALRPITLAATLCGCCAAAPALSQTDTATAEHQLPTTQVTATGLGLSVHDMAAPVSVLDGDTWNLRRDATLGESLTGELGIHSSHFGAGASRPIIRGMDGPRVGVLSHGTELQDASTFSPDHVVVTEPLLLHSVEILRGPAALVHGGAVGGVVNLIDQKIPTQRPDKGYEGTAEVRWGSAAKEKNAAFGLTAGKGPLVLRVEAAGRDAGDYRMGGGRKVLGSFSDASSGTVGLSWVGERGYLGAAYTLQQAQYGLPGHAHAHCHLHGVASLHCHANAHDHGHDHGHEAADVPEVDMRSHRWDVRGEWRQPIAGVEAVRLHGSHTRYGHDEVEDAQVATAFRNRAHDLRLEVLHAPVAGWRGTLGVSSGQRNFSAQGEEGYVPATRTQKQGLFWLEETQWGDWRWQAALRHDRQSVESVLTGPTRKHSGTSASLGTVWKFAPGWQATTSFSHAVRMPSAEELFANGLHMATNTWEIGSSELRPEISNAWDLGVRKISGNTTWNANLYHHRIQGYIYGRTVDQDEGIQLQHTTQTDAHFTGLEGQVRQRINRFVGVSLFGDVVRSQLSGGERLPRTPAARWGLRVDATWKGWEGMAEWEQTGPQNRTAQWESRTGGFGMLNLGASYRLAGTPLELLLKVQNLTDRLAYAHTSAIKLAAPYRGRNITVGLRMAF